MWNNFRSLIDVILVQYQYNLDFNDSMKQNPIIVFFHFDELLISDT